MRLEQTFKEKQGRGVPCRHRIAARAARAIAQRQFPMLLTQFEGHVQLARFYRMRWLGQFFLRRERADSRPQQAPVVAFTPKRPLCREFRSRPDRPELAESVSSQPSQ